MTSAGLLRFGLPSRVGWDAAFRVGLMFWFGTI